MTDKRLRGVIAAVATPCTARNEIDTDRALKLARHLLDNGCDGLNVLGTTGEATSFSVGQRRDLMSEYRSRGLPVERLMVGTGASALADAIALTRHAADLGFGGALLLPPFYYKNPPADGLVAYIDAIAAATASTPIPLYLYHFPGMSAVPWPHDLIRRLRATHGSRIAGLKDSSGDMPYAREATKIGDDFAVFPSTEAVLVEARNGPFAGCISATANLNSDLCGRAWRDGDRTALEQAVAIRGLFDGKPLVSGVKSLLAHIHGDPALARTMPPLASFSAAHSAEVVAGYEAVRGRRAAVA